MKPVQVMSCQCDRFFAPSAVAWRCRQRTILRRSAEDSGHYSINPDGAGRTGGVDPPCGATAELQPVFAGAFHVVVATFVSTADLAMTMVMATPAAFGVFRRPKVAHWSFVLFAHIAFLQ